jgi:uncharacterized protein (DUF2267 family)
MLCAFPHICHSSSAAILFIRTKLFRRIFVWDVNRVSHLVALLIGMEFALCCFGVSLPARERSKAMSQTVVSAFESTFQTTNVWLRDIQEELGWLDRERAYHALRAVLHALRDRLPVDQAAALGAQLPMLIRGFYYEGWHPAGTPTRERKKEDFLAHVAAALRNDPAIDSEDVARAVFRVIARHVSPGEVRHVKIALPGEIRSLWSEEMHSVWF